MRENHYLKSNLTRISAIGLVLLIFIFAISCQSRTTPPTPTPTPTPAPGPAPASTEIKISNFAFAPATITVSLDATVTWTNNDSVTHTVSSRNALFDSGSLSRGATYRYTFEQSGTFEYYCKFHPSMTAKVIVE